MAQASKETQNQQPLVFDNDLCPIVQASIQGAVANVDSAPRGPVFEDFRWRC